MGLELFFDVEKVDTSSYPLYTTFTYPDYIRSLTYAQIRKMGEKEFIKVMLKFRLWAIELNEKYKHPFFGGSKSVKQIVSGFKQFDRLKVDDFSNVIDGRTCIKYVNSNITSGVNHWFPEMCFVDTNKGRNPMLLFYCSEERYIRIVKAVVYNDPQKVFSGKAEGKKISDSLVGVLKIARGSQKVGQFPPYVAKWLFVNSLKSVKSNDLYVYDPCGGWAGRLLAMMAASSHHTLRDKNITFITTDVNSEVHDRFNMLYNFWKQFVRQDMKMTLHKSLTPAEDIHKDPLINKYFGKGNMVFTSPPYYDKERYSKDDNQSFIRYKTYDEWREGFLRGMIQNIHLFLRPGGIFFLNIADVRIESCKVVANVQEDSLRIAKEVGFDLEDEYHMLMTLGIGAGKTGTKNQYELNGEQKKFEPIFKLRRK